LPSAFTTKFVTSTVSFLTFGVVSPLSVFIEYKCEWETLIKRRKKHFDMWSNILL
jgi:hypothetical protein